MATITQAIETSGGGLIRFLRWWRDELGGLLPQRAGGRAPARILVAIDQDSFRVFEGGGAKLRPVRAGLNLSALDAVAAVAELARTNPAARVGIRVPLASCFARTVELPRSAQEDASRILDLDLER